MGFFNPCTQIPLLNPSPLLAHLPLVTQVFETSPFFSFHHCNACEHGRYITVDTVAWDQLSFTGFNVDALSAAYYK